MLKFKTYRATLVAVLLMSQALVAHAQLPDFTGLVEAASPAVVNISTRQKVPQRAMAANGQQMPNLEGLPPQFREFFERSIPQQPRNPGGRQREAQSLGSGFIISADGYVLTNNHVVADADEIIVRLSDRSELEAKLIGADPRTDVALLKVEGKGLPILKLGKSDDLKVGEWVLAIGSPFGFDHSATAGIVSAKGRSLPNESYVPFIQTDVAINPGNSGGPLINMRGEVVGINSQIYSRSGGFQGISFAIPIDEAVRVSDQLKATGRVTRGRIGVQIDQVSKEVAESLGLGQPKGALVRGVEPDSPAAKAGIEPGDIILKFDGKEVEKSVDLPRMVGNTKPGNRSSVTVLRRGSQRDLSITVAELEPDRPETRAAAPEPKAAPVTPALQNLGLALAELTPAERKELSLKGGVRIASADGAAARAGLREGDVILAIGNTEVGSAKEVEAVIARTDRSRPVTVLFRRGDWAQYAVIRPQR